MKAKMEQIPATNLNPVLSVTKEGTVQYSNEAGEPLLQEWGVRIGGKLPSTIREIVQRVISLNSPEKMEVKSEKKAYLVVFHPLPEQDCVNISGFDISDYKNSGERIQESEEKYRAIFENSIDAILLTTPDGTIQEANPAACQMFMMNEEEIIQAGRDGITDASDPRLKSFLEKRARIGKSSEEINHRRKDGTIFPGEVSSAFFKDKNGITRTAMIIRDVSERKLADEALREREERFRSAFDDSAVAMALVCPDARLLKVNDAFCQLLGFEKSEMEGRTFLDYTYPDDIEPSILIHKAVINREKPLFWLEKRYIHKDGRVIWCEVSSSPVFNSKGCPIYTVAHIQDITERKRAEEALRESEEKFRGLVEHVNDLVWEIDADSVYTYASPRARDLLGYEPADLLGTTPFDYMASEEAERVRSLFNPILNAREEFSLLVNTLIRKDGCTVTVETSGMPIYDSQGNFKGYHGIDRDISERKRAEEVLKKAHDNLEEKVKERTART